MAETDTGRHSHKKRPWQRRRRRMLIILIVLAIPVVAAVAWRLEKRTALTNALEAAKAAGIPLTEEAYVEKFGAYVNYWESASLSPDSPYQQVLAAYKREALATLSDLPRFNRRQIDEDLSVVPYPEKFVDALRHFVDENAETYQLLHSALASGSQETPPGDNEKLVLEWLCREACLMAHDGDVEGTFRAIEGCFVLLRGGALDFGADAPCLQNTYHLDLVLNCFASVLRRVRFSEAQLGTLREHLTAGDYEAYRKQENERRDSSNLIEMSKMASTHPEMQHMNMLTGFWDRERSYQLNARLVERTLYGLPLAEQDRIIAQYGDEAWSDYVRPVSNETYASFASAVIDILRFEGARGELPQSLDVLVPDFSETVPIDFWRGGPMTYRQEGRTFTLYGIGRDREDQGGDQRQDTVFSTTLP